MGEDSDDADAAMDGGVAVAVEGDEHDGAGEDADTRRARLAKAVLDRVAAVHRGPARGGDGDGDSIGDDERDSTVDEGDATHAAVSHALMRRLLTTTGRLVRLVGAVWAEACGAEASGAMAAAPVVRRWFRAAHGVRSAPL